MKMSGLYIKLDGIDKKNWLYINFWGKELTLTFAINETNIEGYIGHQNKRKLFNIIKC